MDPCAEKVKHQRVVQRAVRVLVARVHDHSGLLGDGNQVLVLEEHVEGEGPRGHATILTRRTRPGA